MKKVSYGNTQGWCIILGPKFGSMSGFYPRNIVSERMMGCEKHKLFKI